MAIGCYNPDDHYLPASYKGVPFEALEASSHHGRRGAEAEYPWGEDTNYTDLGRAIRTYRISGRFAGNNHVAMSALLIAAVEFTGPGILIHPTRGPVLVACRSLDVSDNSAENGGVTTFDADFVEANIFGEGFHFVSSLLNLGIGAILSASKTSFKSQYNPSDVRWYNSSNVVETMGEGVSSIRDGYEHATDDSTDDENNRWEILADFDTVINDPQILADSENASNIVLNGLDGIDRDSKGYKEKERAFKGVVNWASQSPSLAGEGGDMQNAIFSFLRISAAAHLVKNYLSETPATMSAALGDLDTFTKIINEEIRIAYENCNDPALYRALTQFCSEAQKALYDRAYKSPALVEYNFPGGVASLSAAWEIFGDAKRFLEIESRNPGFPWDIGPAILAPRD